MEFINFLAEWKELLLVIGGYLFLFFILNYSEEYKYKTDKFYVEKSGCYALNTSHELRKYDSVAKVLDVNVSIDKGTIPIIYEYLVILFKGNKFVLSNFELRECDLIYANKYVKGDNVVVNLTDIKPLDSKVEKTVLSFEGKIANYVRKPFWKKSWEKECLW